MGSSTGGGGAREGPCAIGESPPTFMQMRRSRPAPGVIYAEEAELCK